MTIRPPAGIAADFPTPPPLVADRSTHGLVAVSAAVAVFGGMNIIVKSTSLDGPQIAAWRLGLAVVISQVVLAAMGRRLTVDTVRRSLPGGLTFGASMVLFFSAIHHTSIANVSIIVALQAALSLAFVGPVFGERVQRRDIGWTALATVGVATVIIAAGGNGGATLGGDLLAVCGLLLGTGYFVFSKIARERVEAVEYQASVFLVAATVLVPGTWLVEGLPTPRGADIAYIATIGVLGSAAHLSLNWAHKYVPMKRTSLLQLAVPIVSTSAAWVVLGESLRPLQIAAMAVTMTALAATTLDGRKIDPARTSV